MRDLYYACNTFYDTDKRPRYSLESEKEINETALFKVIGLTVETRPDCIDQAEIERYISYGVTRVQLGVQTTDDKILKKINKNLKIFNSKYLPTNLKSFNLKKEYLFFCGLGNPKEFEKTLIKYKFKIKEKIIFPDHYNFTNKDISEIKKIANKKKLDIVTSEKDYFRLNNSNKKNIKYLKVDLKIENNNKFESYLKNTL